MKKLINISLSEIKLNDLTKLKSETLIIGSYETKKISDITNIFDKKSKGVLKKLISREELSGSLGNILYLPNLEGTASEKVYFVGCGKKDKEINEQEFLSFSQKISDAALQSKAKNVHIFIPSISVKNRSEEWNYKILARTLESNCYKYFFKGKKNQPKNNLTKVTLLKENEKKGLGAINKAMKVGHITGVGMNTSRDLANTPANICTPSYLASTAKKLSKSFPVIKTKVLGEKEMKKIGMDCLLSVGNGSAQESKFIIMEYYGAAKTKKPNIIVGKGITFDTGGISIKPSPAMDEMKYDMTGSASVMGTMRAIAEIKPKSNIIAVIAAAENMPSSTATKPGDVVKTLSGQTVEVLNTDAEGRLVLCDALTYVERFNPASVIDIATLTGACVVALGHEATGLLSNDQKLADNILNSGYASCDRAWQLPLWDCYQDALNSKYADIANIGGRAGTITAACFLSRFTKKYNWAHLDIAGTAYGGKVGKKSSGRPVPLLTEYLLSQK
ncbi:MAG: leucyl aminopeptidase [Gammaproteobacteria bacterium]|tara:strand:+ start:106 stop:1614 length:1509 start_codon:yes stop_codon:yes gene_type:complete